MESMDRFGALARIFGLALLLGAPGPARAGEEAPPGLRVETDVQERFYDVRGAGADEVFASIRRRGLGDTPGRAASGLTRSELSYRVKTSTTPEACRITDLTLRADVVVTLPRHAAAATLDRSTRTLWEAYEAQVEFHEYRHVEIEFRGLEELEARLRREVLGLDQPPAGCTGSLDRAIAEQTATTRRRHEEFHVEESRAVREAQADLVAQIERLDEGLAGAREQIESRNARLGDLAAERDARVRSLRVLAERWGDLLPESIGERASESASTVARLDEEIRALAAEQDALAAGYDERAGERRNLVDRLAWTR